MTSRSKKYNYNISASGNFVTNNLNLGVSNMFSGSFSASNNVSSATNVTGLFFNNATTRYFNCQLTVSIVRTSGGNLHELFTLEANQSETGWELYETTISDITGIEFSITSGGQIQYTSSNISNFVSSTFRYVVTQITTTGTYSNLTTGTQGTYVLNSIQLTNTVGSIIGTDPGTLYVMGGSTFDKMISIRTTDNAVGFGTGGGLSVYGGAAVSKNLLVNGNIGVGIVNPINNLDVTGTARITTSLTTGALYATNLTVANAVFTNITTASAQIANLNVNTQTVGTSRITTSLLALGNSNTLGNVFTTGGNVGINIETPGYHLDVNGNVHVNSNLYVDGLISGGTDTGSTFAYLTLTSTDDAVNLSTGSLVTYGGITIQSSTEATSVTNGGSFLTDGGASIGKSLFVGGPIMKIPVGITDDRPNPANLGYVRYNSTTSQFEGYGPGNAWGSLGGVVDIAQTTKVLASANPSSTDGNLYFYTVGTERMRINSAGNVGIGTTAPANTLDVIGTAKITTSITTGALFATNVTVTNVVATTSSAATAVATTYTGGSIGLSGGVNAVTGTIGTFVATTLSAATAVATTYTGGSMSLSGNLSIAGTLTTVNITTTNISETNVSAGTVAATNIGVTTQTVGTSRITTSLLALGNSNTVGNIYTTGGNVGIGATSPGEALDVRGNLRIGNSTQGNYISFYGTSGDGPGEWSHTYIGERLYGGSEGSELLLFKGNDVSGPDRIRHLAANHVFDTYTSPLSGTFAGVGTSGTTRMLIDQNGNVGVGTIAPRSNLEISQSSSTTGVMLYSGLDSGGVNSIFFHHSGRTQGDYRKVAIQTQALGSGQGGRANLALCVNTENDGTNVTMSDAKLFIQGSSGNIGIGTTAPSGMLHLNNAALFTSSGDLTCTGDIISFGNLSDRRLKTDIEDLQSIDAINVVNTLRPVKFKWNDSITNVEKRGSDDIGFIAQEVEEVAPCAVDDFTDISNNTDYKCIKYERLIPYLVGSIQNLTQELQKTMIDLQTTKKELDDLRIFIGI